jgi:hypothetical protein
MLDRTVAEHLKGLSSFDVAQLLRVQKGSRARSRMYVRRCIPRGLFGNSCSRSGLPPSRILVFCARLTPRYMGVSCWLGRASRNTADRQKVRQRHKGWPIGARSDVHWNRPSRRTRAVDRPGGKPSSGSAPVAGQISIRQNLNFRPDN